MDLRSHERTITLPRSVGRLAGMARRLPRAGHGDVDAPPVPGLRRRRLRDLGACQRLLRVVYYERQYPLHWPDSPRAFLAGDDVIDAWVVEQHGEILAHVAVSRVGTDIPAAVRWRELTGLQATQLAAVSRLFVRRRVRERGIGTALLDVATADIRSRGLVPVIELPSTSRDGVALLDGLGWRLLSMDLCGDRTDRLRMLRYAAPPAAG